MRLPLLGTFVVLAATLALGLVWGVGYDVTSLESLAALAAAVLVATLLAALGARWSPLRMALVALLFCLGVDIFFLRNATQAWVVLGAIPALVAVLHRRLPPQVFMVAAAVFLGSLALQRLERPEPTAPQQPAKSGVQAQIVVHWVLDEMGSFESVPPEYRVPSEADEIAQAYRARGFALHASKPSTSADTFLSLSRMASSETDDLTPNHEKVGNNYRVLRNGLRDQFRAQAWDVSVTQSSYLDFCGKDGERCVTYDVGNNARVFSDAGLSLRQRAAVLWREVIVSLLTPARGSVVVITLRAWFPHFFAEYASWSRSRARPGLSLAMLKVLQGQVDYVTALDGRHYVFAHMLLPHFPWNLDRDCSVRPLGEWRTPYAARSPKAKPEVRAATFDAYWRQQVCAHRRVLAAIDGIDAAHPGLVQFLIHGDHGPRILLRRVPDGGHRQAGSDMAVRNAVEPFLASRLHHSDSAELANAETMQQAAKVLLSHTAVGAKQPRH